MHEGKKKKKIFNLFDVVYYLSLAAALSLLMTDCSTKHVQLTRGGAWKIAAKKLLINKSAEVKVYALPSPVKGGTAISGWGRKLVVPEELNQAWFFFVDDAPMANWEHPCRYIFIDFQSALIKVIDSRWPPDLLDQMDKIFPEEKS